MSSSAVPATTVTMAKPVPESSPQSKPEVAHTPSSESSLDPKTPRPTNDSRPMVDALLSPTTADTPTQAAVLSSSSSTTEKEPEENNENIDDESRFSTVSLSAPAETETITPTTASEPSLSGRPNANRSSVSSTTNMEISLVTPRTSMSGTLASTGSTRDTSTAKEKSKRRPSSLIALEPKSATSSTTHNADFILAKLDKDLMSPTKSIRDSMDGKGLLQAEFEQVRNAQKDDDMESITADGINWDFWGLVMSDYESFARTEPKKLARAIEAGVPAALRGMVWQLMSASKDPELEQLYANLLKEKSTHEKAIVRDLGRTFPHHAFFNDGQGVGQESLFNVLKAYSLFDPECGYCQGLPFIVAPLLLVCPDEEAFCLLVRLMQSYELRGHFLPEMPGLQLRLFQFDRLIEDMLPVLHTHFLRQGVKSSMFCSQWFMTLFAYRFPLDLVFRIFDHVLATGVDSIFSFSVLLLQKNEQVLLNLKFDQILDFLKLSLLDCYKIEEELEDGEEERLRVDDFIRDASALRITPFQLDGYANEFIEMRRAQTAHLVEMENLRNENRMLKSRLKKVEDDFAQVETEHCDVINQLVMAKIEKEETEAELVRFKLLYAELMHQHEEGRSPNRMSSMSAMSGNKGVPA